MQIAKKHQNKCIESVVVLGGGKAMWGVGVPENDDSVSHHTERDAYARIKISKIDNHGKQRSSRVIVTSI